VSAQKLSCPRCGHELRAPGIWSDSWTCPEHGSVAPLHPPRVASDALLNDIARRSQVPLWLPWPLPPGWVMAGVQVAGDERTGPVAAVVALAGPNPMVIDEDDALAADLLVVAEQPGVGLAAALAGLDTVDPGQAVGAGPVHAHVNAAGHETPLWSVRSERPDVIELDPAAAWVGEANAVWLWLLAWPRTSSAVLLHKFSLLDLRAEPISFPIPYGALSPRLH